MVRQYGEYIEDFVQKALNTIKLNLERHENLYTSGQVCPSCVCNNDMARKGNYAEVLLGTVKEMVSR